MVKSPKNSYDDFTPEPDPKDISLYTHFSDISHALNRVKTTGRFEMGCYHRVHILDDMEIVLMFEKDFHYRKNPLISITFRTALQKTSCLKLMINLKDDKHKLIEKESIFQCTRNNDPMVRHCYIIIVILLCTFLKFKQVELRDYDIKDWNSKDSKEITGYRIDNYGSTKDNKKVPVYSHHFSYYAPFGFEDKIYDIEKPVKGENNIENLDLIDGLSNHLADRTFIIMIKSLNSNIKMVSNYLKQKKLSNIKMTKDLASLMKCSDSTNNLCQEDMFRLLDTITAPNKQAKFGVHTSRFY